MKLWRLFPIMLFVGVLAAATFAFAADQPLEEDRHNFAAEGEADAQGCDEMEVEYGQDGDGHVDRVKLWYPPGIDNRDDCGGNWAHVEIHNEGHAILSNCGTKQLSHTVEPEGAAMTQFSCPKIYNTPHCTLGNNCVQDIDHVNIVVTDLDSTP